MVLLLRHLLCLLILPVPVQPRHGLEEEFACNHYTHLLQTRVRAEPPKAAAPVSGLFVLDVSAPRSGTQSFYTALNALGLNPIHTGYNWTAKPVLYDYMFRNGSFEAVAKTLEGHSAALDSPVFLMYKDIMKLYPEAKFVMHPVHHRPQDWYRSVVKLAHNLWCFNATSIEGLDDYVPREVFREGPVIDASAPPLNYSNIRFDVDEWDPFRFWDCHFDHAIQTREEVHACLDMYVAHEQAVRREIPADKLLIFDYKEGWAPLCDFLDLPVPSGPFPHPVDEYAEPMARCAPFYNLQAQKA